MKLRPSSLIQTSFCKTTLTLMVIVFLLYSSPNSWAGIIIENSGQFTGVQDLNVNGKYYNVSFAEGSFLTVFGGYDPQMNFAFDNRVDSLNASLALLNLVNTNTNYDWNPNLTFGIEALDRGNIYIPYTTDGVTVITTGYSNFNQGMDINDHNMLSHEFALDVDFTNESRRVWSVWEEATTVPVPEPATLTFCLLGVLVLLSLSRWKYSRRLLECMY